MRRMKKKTHMDLQFSLHLCFNMKNRDKRYFIVFLIIFALTVQTELTRGDEISIIVNKANPIVSISFNELVKIFKRERQFWKDGKKVYIIMQEAGSMEKEIALKKIYKMDHGSLKKFWIERIFRGEISSFPIVLSSNDAVKMFVSQISNAIGFINADTLDGSVKALKIDGRLPGTEGYILIGKERE